MIQQDNVELCACIVQEPRIVDVGPAGLRISGRVVMYQDYGERSPVYGALHDAAHVEGGGIAAA